MLLPAGTVDLRTQQGCGARVAAVDLSTFSPNPPNRPLDLLFIHHSVGGQWMADPGTVEGTNCIFRTHADGGGLRSAIEKQGYTVNEASYQSRIGQDTAIFDWPKKFRNQMEQILTCQVQDVRLPEGRRNRIVMFKSCFPNSWFNGPGIPPGRADGPKTVVNAKAAYNVLLDPFENHPDVLFVCVTAPPLAPRREADPLWKAAARKMLGQAKPSEGFATERSARA